MVIGGTYNLEQTLLKADKLRITGNVIPNEWYKHPAFKTKSGKTYLLAILILSEILYWYRPTRIVDEQTGQLVSLKKKFAADMLQRQLQPFADKFGVNKRQVSEALKHLEEQNLIIKESRTIDSVGGKIGNVLYMAPVIDNIIKLQDGTPIDDSETGNNGDNFSDITIEGGEIPPLCKKTYKVVQNNVVATTENCSTYTKNTTKTTTEKTAAIGSNEQKPTSSPELEKSAAAFLDESFQTFSQNKTEQDKIIVEQLTANQNQLAVALAHFYQEHCQSPDVNTCIDEVVSSFLDPSCYPKTGGDFLHKFNTFRKQMRLNLWTPSTKKAKEQQIQQQDESDELAREINTYRSKVKQTEWLLTSPGLSETDKAVIEKQLADEKAHLENLNGRFRTLHQKAQTKQGEVDSASKNLPDMPPQIPVSADHLLSTNQQRN